MIHFDLETKSELDLKAVGAYRYAEHPSTDVTVACWSYDVRGQLHCGEWRPGSPPPEDLLLRIANGGMFVAGFNIAFDAELWHRVLSTRYGWYWPGYDVFYDTMAQAQITNLPGKLEKAAAFFGSVEKDMAGHKLMMALARPAKQTARSRKAGEAYEPWAHHTGEAMDRLAWYCHRDVAAERGFSAMVPLLSQREERIWRATWRMNRRGMHVDLSFVARCQALAEAAQKRYRGRLRAITGGAVPSEHHRARLGRWLVARGACLPRTDKGNYSFGKEVEHLVDLSQADGAACEAYETYRTLNKSSVSKLRKMSKCVCADNRLRGMICYSGATQTGRDAGRLVQLQNLPKGMIEGTKSLETLRCMIARGADLTTLELSYGSALEAIATAIRMCLVAAPGYKLVFADLSAIEGRVLAWLAGEDAILHAYETGKRVYAVTASGIFGCTYEQVLAEKKDGDSFKDRIGKIAELAGGYQGSVDAYKLFGANQLGLSDARIEEFVDAWRKVRWRTVRLWRAMLDAAVQATNHPGLPVPCGRVTFGHNGRHLRMLLPSGRCLWYRRARVGEKVWPDGGTSPQVEYYGVDGNHVGWCSTYGGQLTENATQAISRDVFMSGVLAAEDEGWPVVLRVHDEMGAELPVDDPRDHRDLCEVMVRKLPWCPDLPLAAAGWTGQFYRKD